MNPIAISMRFGRWAIMESGFGAILERFEKTFGSRVVNFILALIGIAIALTCGKAIWDIALGPAMSFIAKLTEHTTFWEGFLKVFWAAVAWVGGVAFGLLVTGSFMAWKRAQEAGRVLARAEAAHARVEAEVQKAMALAEATGLVSAEIIRIREEEASKEA